MGYEPGLMPLVAVTPEDYMRMMSYRAPNVWPVYFGTRIAGHFVQDMFLKAVQDRDIGSLQANLELMLEAGHDVADRQARVGPEGSAAALKADITRLRFGLYDNWRSGVWSGVGAAYSNAMDSFLATGQLIYAYKTLAYHTAVTPRMRRHWNKLYTPRVPEGAMAWVLYRRGHFTRGQYDEHVAYDGWSKEGAEQLLKSMVAQPSPREAFYLWAKGIVGLDERDRLYFAGGWEPEWHSRITENLYYTPSIYDLTRIADNVELDQIWALDKMRRRGVTDTDRAKFWEMLKIRPLREEIRSLTQKALYAREHGYWSHDGLDDYWSDLAEEGYIKPTERGLLNDYGDLLYEIELKEEWIEILRWRFRTALITEEQFLEGLTDPDGPVAMLVEKANLIVDLEKAKGYYGYY